MPRRYSSAGNHSFDSNPSIGFSVEVVLDGLIRSSSTRSNMGVYTADRKSFKKLQGATTMNRGYLLPLCLATITLSSGCSMMAPRYTASIENVQKIKDADTQPVKVGTFESTPGKGNANPISIRGSSLASPYDSSYAKYIAEALRQDLELAGRLAPDAKIEISGALQKNDVNIPAVGSGTGDLEARFIVKRAGETKYNQVKTIHDVWESSFVGAVAIPRAQARYPIIVQKLLAELYADPAFIEALK
jgi:hypothetical protein